MIDAKPSRPSPQSLFWLPDMPPLRPPAPCLGAYGADYMSTPNLDKFANSRVARHTRGGLAFPLNSSRQPAGRVPQTLVYFSRLKTGSLVGIGG